MFTVHGANPALHRALLEEVPRGEGAITWPGSEARFSRPNFAAQFGATASMK
jgi:hypothetical protein